MKSGNALVFSEVAGDDFSVFVFVSYECFCLLRHVLVTGSVKPVFSYAVFFVEVDGYPVEKCVFWYGVVKGCVEYCVLFCFW